MSQLLDLDHSISESSSISCIKARGLRQPRNERANTTCKQVSVCSNLISELLLIVVFYLSILLNFEAKIKKSYYSVV